MKKIKLGEHLLIDGTISPFLGYALVDNEDYEKLSQYNWGLNSFGYVARLGKVDGKWKMILMHRIIMDTPKGMVTDHINGNKVDNRKKNLRVCTHQENCRNSTKHRKTNKSGYHGVSAYGKKKWQANIRGDGGVIRLGTFLNKIDAAKAYDEAAKKYHKDFATLNFSNSSS